MTQCYCRFVPSEAIRNYYGEKIALYFTYLGHYTKYLSYMVLISLFIGVLQFAQISENVDSISGIIFGFCNVLWINLMINEWFRTEKYYAAKFG